MLYIADVYGLPDLAIIRDQEVHHVGVDHMMVQMMPVIARNIPARTEFFLGVDGESSLRQLRHAYSQGLRSLLPWNRRPRRNAWITFPQREAFRVENTVLSFKRGIPVLNAVLPYAEVTHICAALQDNPFTLHVGGNITSQLAQIQERLRRSKPQAHARLKRSGRWL